MPDHISRNTKRELHIAKNSLWLTYGLSIFTWPLFNLGNAINAYRMRSFSFLFAAFVMYFGGWGMDKVIFPDSSFGPFRPLSSIFSAGIAGERILKARKKMKVTPEQADKKLKGSQGDEGDNPS